MAVLSEQVVIGGTVRLSGGSLMPLSTYESEVGRIREQSFRKDPWISDTWRDKQCQRCVINQYGRRCYDCKDVIVIDYDVEPILRPLHKDDAASTGCGHGFFHADCWSLYKVDHANKRRRSSYSGQTPPQPPQPPVPLHCPHHNHVVVEDEPPALANEDQVKDDEAEDKPTALAIEDQVRYDETKDQPPEHASEEQHQEAEVDG